MYTKIPRAQKTLSISVYTNLIKYTDTRYTTHIPTPLPTQKSTYNINPILRYTQLTSYTHNTQSEYTDITIPNQYIIIHITNTNISFLGSWFSFLFCVPTGVFRKGQEHTHPGSCTIPNTIALKI